MTPDTKKKLGIKYMKITDMQNHSSKKKKKKNERADVKGLTSHI